MSLIEMKTGFVFVLFLGAFMVDDHWTALEELGVHAHSDESI